MSKRLLRLTSLVLAIMLIASLAIGCGDNNPSSNNSSGDSSNTSEGKVSGMLPEVKLEDYKGTTVKFATWKNPWQNEDGDAVDAFMQETGINVEWVQYSEGEYVNQVIASMVSDQQADVFFENGTFPGSLGALQPLDATKIDFNDSFWNQSLIKASSLDGHPYLIDSNSNVWTEIDICVYNKHLFESNGITTPSEYYEAGKWTFDTFRDLAMEISSLGKQYTGAVSLVEPPLGAAGCSTFTYANNIMSVTVNPKLIEVSTYLAKMREDGYLKMERKQFEEGKTGMALTNCFGLKKRGYFTQINSEDVAATYLPVWKEGDPQYACGIYRGWGLIDGAKNPVGAGLFLRWYLDSGNYDLANTFHNEDVADFFFEVVSKRDDNMIYYRDSDLVKTTGLGRYFSATWAGFSSTNIQATFDSHMNTMNEMCEKANEVIQKEREWIKQAEQNGTINKAS